MNQRIELRNQKKCLKSDEKKADENEFEKCEFVAKNEQALKIHMKAKHAEHNRIKYWKSDSICATKNQLTEHNDAYYYTHRGAQL